MNSRRAFTLVELLLVTALVAVISIAVAHSFANGLRLWARADSLTRQSGLAIFAEQLSQDLRQTVVIRTLKFQGTETQVLFPALVLVKPDPQGSRAHEQGLVHEIGYVRYRFDASQKKVFRSQSCYGQSVKGIFDQEEAVAEGIEQMRFSYHLSSYKQESGRPEVDGEIPLAVSVDIGIMVDGKMGIVHRLCLIPVGGER